MLHTGSSRRDPLRSSQWYRGEGQLLTLSGIEWSLARFNRFAIWHLLRYATSIFVPYFKVTSVFGFSLLLNMVTQMASGLLLALYYTPDPSFVLTHREELQNEVWWFPYVHGAHVVGVDTIFTLSYLHILKKVYIRNYAEGDLDGWFTGAYAFMIFHVVVFLGITLSTNHLGDVTVTIVANIVWSLFLRWHKAYTIFFGNKHLSIEQLTRFMLAHYIVAWYYIYLVQSHVMFIHEMWDADSNHSTQQDTTAPKLSWVWDALKKEAMSMFALYNTLAATYLLLAHPDPRVVNITFFEQWSETEMEDINFFIVGPHWYFRPHMGLLTVCAQHYEGLAWLGGFYVLLVFMPHLHRAWNPDTPRLAPRAVSPATRHSLLSEALYVTFLASMVYTGGTLPCGRFYYDAVEGFFGNSVLRLSYEYVYLYMAVFAHVSDRLERWYLALPAWHKHLRQVSLA